MTHTFTHTQIMTNIKDNINPNLSFGYKFLQWLSILIRLTSISLKYCFMRMAASIGLFNHCKYFISYIPLTGIYTETHNAQTLSSFFFLSLQSNLFNFPIPKLPKNGHTNLILYLSAHAKSFIACSQSKNKISKLE